MSIYTYATQLTREHIAGKKNPERCMHNRKPFRSAALKQQARDNAELVDGRYVSNILRSYHAAPKDFTKAKPERDEPSVGQLVEHKRPRRGRNRGNTANNNQQAEAA